jgi:hypothetical protein
VWKNLNDNFWVSGLACVRIVHVPKSKIAVVPVLWSLERKEVILYEPLSAPLATFQRQLEYAIFWCALVDDLRVQNPSQNLDSIDNPAAPTPASSPGNHLTDTENRKDPTLTMSLGSGKVHANVAEQH